MKKYEASQSISTEQLVQDLRELLTSERIVLEAIVSLFVELGHDAEPITIAPAAPTTTPDAVALTAA